MNITHDSFTNVVVKKTTNNDLWERLNNIIQSSTFQQAKGLRNDVTHNYLPTSVGLSVISVKNNHSMSTSVGVRDYVKLKDILDNITEAINLIQETIIIS